MALSDSQQRFVDEYLVDLNGGKAAIRAGYSANGAYMAAHRLLRNREIAEAIEAGRKARGEETRATAARVIYELARVAFADIRTIARWDAEKMEYVPSDDLDDDSSAAIAEVTDKTNEIYGKGGQITNVKREQRIKMHDKLKALEMIGRHLGMFKADEGQDQAQLLTKVLEVLALGGVSMDQIVSHLSVTKKPA